MPNFSKVFLIVAATFALSACATAPKPQERVEADLQTPTRVAPAQVEPAQAETDTVERTVRFAYNSSILDPSASTILDKMAKNLRANQEVAVHIEGHTDDVGGDAFNLALGEERARSVRNYLVRQGVPPARISMISYGKERPTIDDTNDDARAVNRRGELVIK